MKSGRKTKDFHFGEDYLDRQGIRTTLSETDLKSLSEFIKAYSGVNIKPSESHLFEAELKKRVRNISIKSFKDYVDFNAYSRCRDEKLIHLTDSCHGKEQGFFMGHEQLRFLVDRIIPNLAPLYGRKKTRLKIWCPACSSGYDPYTISMIMDAFIGFNGPGYSVLASDLSTNLLFRAIMGIYDESEAKRIPISFRKQYVLRSRKPGSNKVRITPELRETILFRKIDPKKKNHHLTKSMDIIFYRKAIIYLDHKTRSETIKNLCSHLATGGYLFLGPNESIEDIEAPLVRTGCSIYKKIDRDN